MNFFQVIKLKHKPSLRQKIKTKKGKYFICNSFGKQVYKGEYQDVYSYIEINSEESPIQFYINYTDFSRAIELGKLMYN